jgi:hypothetical protein
MRPSTSSASFWSGPDTRMALRPAALCAAQVGRTHGRTNSIAEAPKNRCQRGAVHTGSSRDRRDYRLDGVVLRRLSRHDSEHPLRRNMSRQSFIELA